MHDVVAAALLLLGSLFMFVAAIGIIRLPDLFMCMSAASKGSSLGAGLCLTAVAVSFAGTPTTARAVATIVFVFLTVPVAAHMVGRAGYLGGVPIAPTTRVDELRGKYDRDTGDLQGRKEDP